MKRLFPVTLVAVFCGYVLAGPVTAAESGAYLSQRLSRAGGPLVAWNRMLATAPAPAWLTDYINQHGAEAPAKAITVAGTSYLVYTTCKPHDCFTSFAVVFSTDGRAAWGALGDYGHEPRFFGTPNANLAAALRNALAP